MGTFIESRNASSSASASKGLTTFSASLDPLGRAVLKGQCHVGRETFAIVGTTMRLCQGSADESGFRICPYRAPAVRQLGCLKSTALGSAALDVAVAFF